MSLFYSISKKFLQGCFWSFYAHKTVLPENIEIPQGVIIAANHASFLDPPMITISWPGPIHFLARKTLFDSPVLSPLIKALNAHPLNISPSSKGASQLTALRHMTILLKEKKSILIFPEGTRSKDGLITSFKPGVSLVAKKANAPIVPAYIHGSFTVWPRHKRFPGPFGYQTACIFGEPIYPDDEETQEALTEKVEREVRRLRENFLLYQESEPL